MVISSDLRGNPYFRFLAFGPHMPNSNSLTSPPLVSIAHTVLKSIAEDNSCFISPGEFNSTSTVADVKDSRMV